MTDLRNIRVQMGFLGNYAHFVLAGLGFKLTPLYQMESPSAREKRLDLNVDLEQIEAHRKAGEWEAV